MKPLAAAVFVWVGAILAPACLADGVDAMHDGSAPILRFHADLTDPAFGSVDLQHLNAEAIGQLRRAGFSPAQWQRVFSVYVTNAGGLASVSLPPVLGRYEVLSNQVRFTPRFPPARGVTYLASADLAKLLGGQSVSLALKFSLPREVTRPTTVVDRVFPTSHSLPENLLRFYVYFSAPMQRGGVRDHVVLLGPDGKPTSETFFNSSIELWDPAMRRLTLLLDPGRIKRGVGLNVQLGAPLQRGLRYTLVIDKGMIDATGRPLRQSFSKPFSVSAAVREPIDAGRWKVKLPTARTRQPLVLNFSRSLDQALLSRTVLIVGPDQHPVAGQIAIERHETQWIFTPSSLWSSGPYQLRVDSSLEDVNGNTVWAPFDADSRSDVTAENHIELPFVIRPQMSPSIQPLR